jgi:hypothetical protein
MVGDSSLGFAAGQTVLAWITEQNGGLLRYRVAGGGNLNLNASWGPIQTAATNVSWVEDLEIGFGRSGLFALYNRTGDGPVVRKWNGSGFGRVRKLADNGIFGELSQDPSGRLHAVWTKAPPLEPRGPLMYSQSDDGSRWTKPSVLVRRAAPGNTQPAMNASGQGVVAYDGQSTAEVFFARLKLPAPKPGKTVNVAPVRGTVKTKCKGDGEFQRLDAAKQVPVGCKVDTQRGAVRLTTSKGTAGGTQSGEFNGGLFKINQKKTRHPYAVLKLAGSLHCSRGKAVSPAGPRPAAKGRRKPGRRLWGNGKGKFRTRGRHGAASVRGTSWLVEDRCSDSTLFKVRSGVVKVNDFEKRKTLILRKGERYVAKAKR